MCSSARPKRRNLGGTGGMLPETRRAAPVRVMRAQNICGKRCIYEWGAAVCRATAHGGRIAMSHAPNATRPKTQLLPSPVAFYFALGTATFDRGFCKAAAAALCMLRPTARGPRRTLRTPRPGKPSAPRCKQKLKAWKRLVLQEGSE